MDSVQLALQVGKAVFVSGRILFSYSQWVAPKIIHCFMLMAAKAVWNFSENSSVLEEVGFPKGLNSGLALYNLAGMRNSLEYR